MKILKQKDWGRSIFTYDSYLPPIKSNKKVSKKEIMREVGLTNKLPRDRVPQEK